MFRERKVTSILSIILMTMAQPIGPALATPKLPRQKGASPTTQPQRAAPRPTKTKPIWSPELERVKRELLDQLESGAVSSPAVLLNKTVMSQAAPPVIPGGEVLLSHSFEYDAKGNPTKRVDANGNVILQSYDELDRLVRIDYSDSTFVAYGYDKNGNRESMTDATGATEYEYDDLDRQTKITYPDGNWLDIEYDNLSRISRWWYVDGTDVHFTYYNDGRIRTIDRDGAVTAFTYDAAGRIATKAFSNGCKTIYSYDAFGRLVRIRHEGLGAQLISQFDYTLDKFGNRTQIIKTTPAGAPSALDVAPTVELAVERQKPKVRRGDPAISEKDLSPSRERLSFASLRKATRAIRGGAVVTETMRATYDEMDRLTQVTYPDGRIVSYTFDEFNNRTSKTEIDGAATKVTTYVFDANNRLMLTRIDGNTDEEFTYDGNGNMTARKRFGHITRYQWDHENRLTAVIKPSGERVEYAYNGEDNLWQRKVSYMVGARTTNFYTTDSPDMPMILNEYTLETGRIAAHVYAGDALIESEVWEDGDTAYAAYLTGEYNASSISELRSSAGNPMYSLDYPDVYGPANPSVIVGALAPGYTGEFYDTESHLQFLRARWYDPTLGVFISQDKIQGDVERPYSYVNRYTYTENNPLNRRDPTGRRLWYDTWTEESGRYEYDVDWRHHTAARNIARSAGGILNPLGGFTASQILGLIQETAQLWADPESAFKPQDLRSNFLGGLAGAFELPGIYTPDPNNLYDFGWPGGVRLDHSAMAYFDIGGIAGATYDPDTGQIVLYGEESNAQLPGMRMDDLAMVIRLIFDHGVAPELSLDPVPGEDWHHKWRYGPPDRPYLMDDTHLGWVMKEADRVLKYLSLGRNPWNISETLPAGFISGYRSYVDSLGDYPCESGSQRFWIHPDEIKIEESPDGGTLKFVYASMMLSTEETLEARSSSGPLLGDANRDGKVTRDDLAWVKTQLRHPVTANNYRADVNGDTVIDEEDLKVIRTQQGSTIASQLVGSTNPAADDFVAWFNTHWQELRNYDFTPNDPNDPNIFQELEALAKVYGVVKWIKDNNIPFDTSWVSTYDVYYTANETPQYNDVMDVEGPCDGGTVVVTGGVSLCKDLTIDGVTVPPPVLSQRPGESTMGWTFVDPGDGQTYRAAGISAARRYKDGAASRTETDLSVDGRAGRIELTRTYNSFDAAYYPSRWTWEPMMVRPKGRAMDQIECDDVILFAPAGIYVVDQTRSTEFHFGGVYDDVTDPQAIMNYFGSFNASTDVMGYFDAGLLGDNQFHFLKQGTIYADFPTPASGDHEGPRSGWLLKNRTNDSWSFFNPDGKILWVKDAHGNQTDYTRDGAGRLQSIADTDATISLTYSGEQLASASASNGTSVTYNYNGTGHLDWAQLDTGQRIDYYYDADGLLNDVRDENTVSLIGTTNDVYGRANSTELLGFTDPFSREFNLDTGATEESGPLGDWTTQYNQDYLPTRTVDPLAHETEMIWNDYKLLITRIEGAGTQAEQRTDHYYYSNGDLLAVRRANAVVEITERNPDGRPETTLLLDPCTTFLDGNFDSQHIFTGAAGGILDCINPSDYFDYQYTRAGKLDRKTATVMGFDAESYSYDAQGRMLTSADGEGHTLSYTYDGNLVRISRITNELSEFVDYTYDTRDRLQTVTSGILPVHYEYDARDRVSAVVQGDPGGYGAAPDARHRTEYSFDPVYGILQSVKSPNQVVTNYTYNAQKLLERITHANRVVYEYMYDGAGRVSQISFLGTVGGALQSEKGWFYDADVNAFIDEADLDWFATAWLKEADDPTIQYPPNARFGLTYDYDLDGIVGPNDLSFFSTGWMRTSNDPEIVSPPVALAY